MSDSPSPVRASAQEWVWGHAGHECAGLHPGHCSDCDYQAQQLEKLLLAAEARGRQQAEQARDTEIARLTAERDTDALHIKQINDAIRKMVEAAAPFQVGGELQGVLAPGDSTVIDGMRWLFAQRAALTQALKDIRANLIMAAQQPDGSIGGGMTAMGCHSLVDAIDAALTGAQA